MTDDKKPLEEDIYKKLNAFKPLSKKLKKYPCRDCFNCLFCSDLRCKSCLAQQPTKKKKE